jgi:hypothetical protein
MPNTPNITSPLYCILDSNSPLTLSWLFWLVLFQYLMRHTPYTWNHHFYPVY